MPTQDEVVTEDDEPSDIDAAADIDVFDALISDEDVPPSPPRSPILPSHKVGDNVLAKWGRKGSKYLAHVTKVRMTGAGPVYDVYFLEDGEVRQGLIEDDLSPSSSNYPTRGEMIGRVFYCDGGDDLNPGQWKVRRIDGNTYQCVRLTGSGVNLESFDIGYVITEWVQNNQNERERGPLR